MNTHKRCTRCEQDLPVSAFYKVTEKKRNLTYYKAECRPCHLERNRDWLGTRFEIVSEYLKTHSCVDCGETDRVVLEFDHVGDKVAPVSVM